MTTWCAECGIKGEPTPAIGVFDGDPLCALHAQTAGHLATNEETATAPAVDVNKKETAMNPEGRRLCTLCNKAPLRKDNKTGICVRCQQPSKYPDSKYAKPRAEREPKAAKANGNAKPHAVYLEHAPARVMPTDTVDIPQIPIAALDNWFMKLPAADKATAFSRWLQGA